MKHIPRLHSTSILIIDDCCDTASVLCELMALKGYENVSWTTDSDALASLCSGNHYELILLDMHMPAISGLDVMHYLRDSEHASCVPVIAISGGQRYKLAALEAGACAFLLKPFDYDELDATVFTALGTRYGSITSHRTACKEALRSRMTKGAGSTIFTSSLPPPRSKPTVRSYCLLTMS
jgi:two-component system cell cycle response regulator